MKRTFGALALGALLLTVGACSSTSNSSSTTTAAPGTTAASSSGSTTAKTNDTKATTTGSGKTNVTKPTKVEKIDKSKLPTKAQTADQGISGLTTDQQDCIDYAIYTTVSADPTLADNEAQLAGVIGGSIVACVPQELIATGITQGITSSSGGANITSEQATCIQNTLTTADPNDIAILIGGTIINEPSIIVGAASALDSACGTKLAG